MIYPPLTEKQIEEKAQEIIAQAKIKMEMADGQAYYRQKNIIPSLEEAKERVKNAIVTQSEYDAQTKPKEKEPTPKEEKIKAEVLKRFPSLSGSIEEYNETREKLQNLALDNQNKVFDYKTKKGRTEARSWIHSLRKTKSPVDKIRKERKKFFIEQGKKIDSEAKAILEQIEEMINFHLDPVEEEESRLKAEVEEKQQRIDEIYELSKFTVNTWDILPEEIERRKKILSSVDITTFGDRRPDAADALITVRGVLDGLLENAKSNAQRVEKEKAEERARIKALEEAKAEKIREEERQRQAKEKARIQAEKAKAEAEKAEAERKAQEAEEKARDAEEKAKKQAEEMERLKAEAIAAARQRDAEDESKAQDLTTEKQIQVFNIDERQVIAEICQDLIKLKVAPNMARIVATALIRGKVRHVGVKNV